MDKVFREIKKFQEWAGSRYPGQAPNEIGWEWETNYSGWDEIASSFEEVLKRHRPDDFSEAELSDLVYIIARDNECEILADMLSAHEQWLLRLCALSLKLPEPDARWQMAVRLKTAKNREEACRLLEKLVQDEQEYVGRRALMELPALLPGKVEVYAKQFWERGMAAELRPYQRMAALDALQKVNSPLLETYLQKAEESGDQYLSQFAEGILRDRKQT